MWYGLLSIIAIILFVIGLNIGRHNVQSKQTLLNSEVEEKNKQLDKEYLEKLERNKNTFEELREKEIEATNKTNKIITEQEVIYAQNISSLDNGRLALLEHLETERNIINQKIETYKDTKFSEINKNAAVLRNNLFDKCQSEFDAKKLTFEENYDMLILEKKKLEKNITELQNVRAAAIEAQKREEEIRLQSDFYKVKLKENDIEDIKLLHSIERYLYNKDPLYKLVWSTFYMKPLKDMIGRVVGPNKVSGIYKITNQINGLGYIGQSVDIANRWTDHVKASLGIGTIAHQKVHVAIAEYGIENFTFEVIEKCDKDQLSVKEKIWIKTYQTDTYGYNQTAGGAKEVEN